MRPDLPFRLDHDDFNRWAHAGVSGRIHSIMPLGAGVVFATSTIQATPTVYSQRPSAPSTQSMRSANRPMKSAPIQLESDLARFIFTVGKSSLYTLKVWIPILVTGKGKKRWDLKETPDKELASRRLGRSLNEAAGMHVNLVGVVAGRLRWVPSSPVACRRKAPPRNTSAPKPGHE
jgi:hypothetical protein